MSEPLRESVHQGTIRIMGVDLKVHVLSNGKRVIEEDSFNEFFEAAENGPKPTEEEATNLARFIKGVDGLG